MRRYATGLVGALKKYGDVREIGDLNEPVGYYKKYFQYFLKARTVTAGPALILSERFSFLLRALNKASSKTVVCHDLITMKNPNLSWMIRKRYGYTLNTMLKHADHIVCISASTKNDLIEYSGNDTISKLQVIHNGLEDFWFDVRPGVPSITSLTGRPYFLVVGTDAWYKNFSTVIEALAQMPKDVSLVKVGRLSDQSRKLLKTKGMEQRVIELSRISDADLASLYSNATALLQPSWMEGFGWPPAEAMAVGCPVIVSNRSSLPEVCGEAALYIDPADYTQLANAMMDVLSSELQRSSMKEKGRRQAEKFRWDETATKFVSLLHGK
jgi:glycosyltransferase involved in cell wall biosynthesis